MTKKRKTKQSNYNIEKKTLEKEQKKQPVYSRLAFNLANAFVIAGFVIQLIMAVIVYGRLPERIPASWIGGGSVTQTMPSWVVFFAFPFAQVILYLIGYFSHLDDKNKKVMDWGKSISLILLTILFTALQGSAFYIKR